MAYKKSNPNSQATMANSEPVVIASDQSAVPVSSTTLATAAKQDTGNTSVGSIDTKTPALGQAAAAASVPVILPSATITTLTPPAAITGFATAANQLANGHNVVVTSAPTTAVTGTFWQATQPISLSTLPVTNAGTFAIQVDGSALTALQLIDDPIATLGTTTYTEATTKGNIMGAVRRDANTTLVDTTNEVAPLQVNATGELKVIQITAPTTPVTGTFWQGTQPVSGTFWQATQPISLATLPVTNAGTFAVQIAANSSVNVAQINGVTPLMGTGIMGTGSHRVTIASDNDALTVKQATAANLKAEITIAATQTLSTVTTVSTVTNLSQQGGVAISLNTGARDTGTQRVTIATNDIVQVVGELAHDAVDSGNPQKMGGKTIAHGTNPTQVAAADRTDWYFNRAGVPFVIGGHPNIVTIRANYTGANTDVAIVTIATGLKIVVTRISVLASNANTVNVSAVIGFGTVNTPTTTDVVLAHPNIAAGSGVVEGNGAGILGVGADDADLRITSSVPTTGSIDVVVSYYTIES